MASHSLDNYFDDFYTNKNCSRLLNFIAKNIAVGYISFWISSIIEWKNKFAILEHLVLLGYTLLCSNSLLYYICYILFDFSRWLHHRFILSNRMPESGKMFLNSWQWALWFINLRKMFAYVLCKTNSTVSLCNQSCTSNLIFFAVSNTFCPLHLSIN